MASGPKHPNYPTAEEINEFYNLAKANKEIMEEFNRQAGKKLSCKETQEDIKNFLEIHSQRDETQESGVKKAKIGESSKNAFQKYKKIP